MGRLEHPQVFDAQSRQLVDVEEAPVVDLVRRHAPIGEPIGLRGEERVQASEVGLARVCVEQRHGRRDAVGDLVAFRAGAGEPRFDRALFLVALAPAIGLRFFAQGQALAGGKQGLERIGCSARLRARGCFQRRPEHQRIACGIERKALLAVADVPDRSGQGLSERRGDVVRAAHGELDLLIDVAGEAPGVVSRPHQVRLEGGDCSSDSYCYP